MIRGISSNKYLSILILFTASFWVFGPKINLIAVPSFEQGVRLEDILFIVIYGITLLRSGKFTILGGKYGIALTVFMFTSFFFSFFFYNSNFSAFLFSARWLEYLLMGSILFQAAFAYRNQVLKLFKCYIILNTCAAFALHYISEDNSRYQGISAGPWEVTTVMLLCFISLKPFFKSQREFYFYAICVLLVIVASQARIQFLAYLALLACFKETRYKVPAIILLIIIYLFAFGMLDESLRIMRLEKINLVLVLDLFQLVREAGPDLDYDKLRENLPGLDSPLIGRVVIWSNFIYKWLDIGLFAYIFGIGPGVANSVNVDGFYIRLLTEFGVVGTFIFFLFIKKLMSKLSREYQIQLVLTIGIVSLTLDPFTSSRIFSAISLSLGLLLSCDRREDIIKINKQVKIRHSDVNKIST